MPGELKAAGLFRICEALRSLLPRLHCGRVWKQARFFVRNVNISAYCRKGHSLYAIFDVPWFSEREAQKGTLPFSCTRILRLPPCLLCPRAGVSDPMLWTSGGR